MLAYITRRVLYSVPILVCVNLITFFLFFYVNTPDDVAHSVLGAKYGNPANVYTWKREHQYHLPTFLNLEDRIVYVNGPGGVPEEIREVLEGMDIFHASAGKEEISESLIDEEADEPYLDALRKRMKQVREGMSGNEVIVVDWPGIGDRQAAIVASLLEQGVPLVVLLRGESKVPRPLNLAVVAPYQVRSGAGARKDLERLRSYIEQQQVGGAGVVTETLFFKKSVRLFWFDFGRSDRENIDISYQVLTRMGPSLMITVPAFILGLGVNIFIAMIVAYCRGTYVDRMVAVICIVIMSILSLFYYFSSQLVFGVWLKVFPVSGYLPDFSAIRFVLLPVLVSVVIGIGGGVRFYRTIFLEETNREYVRTARAKGLNQAVILFKHVLKNAMIPILTNVVLVIPMLFVGSLILESFFAIPGLGRFTLEGIQAQDFRIVGSMVYLGSFLYIVGLIMTDISYTLVDPRVRLE
jgi:peptide/nickel transport system permease protein